MLRDSADALLSGVRFGKFVSVGAVGAVFDMATTTALIVSFGVLGEYAKLVGAEVAIVVMFAINERWTFSELGKSGAVPTLSRFVRSNIVRSGGLAVQFLIVRALRQLSVTVPVFGFDLWQLIPIPIAIGASVVLNYVAESLLTWRVTRS
ncbi:GtrA family protein [Halobellus sp. EA9]|uniref:GtrA family protein n=1 Tax=Halobellus sp. EA9 TaxID=3421647 RepID=UPI003EBE8E0A